MCLQVCELLSLSSSGRSSTDSEAPPDLGQHLGAQSQPAFHYQQLEIPSCPFPAHNCKHQSSCIMQIFARKLQQKRIELGRSERRQMGNRKWGLCRVWVFRVLEIGEQPVRRQKAVAIRFTALHIPSSIAAVSCITETTRRRFISYTAKRDHPQSFKS